MPRRKRRRSRMRSFLNRLLPTCLRPKATADSPDVDQTPIPDSSSEVDCIVTDPNTVMKDAVKVLQQIGVGCFGRVYKGKVKTEEVALKLVKFAFQSEAAAKATYREVFYMGAMEHPNILTMKGIFQPGNPLPNALCIVTEIMECDLWSMMKRGTIDPGKKSYIMYQLLSALTYMHARNLIHRDVKPTNVLLNSSNMVKLCDFGLVRSLSAGIDKGGRLTPRCGCPNYRSPELLVGSKCYTKAIDVWAAGAVLVELFVGTALVRGYHLFEQLVRLMPSVTVKDAVRLRPPNVEAVKYKIVNSSRPPGSACGFEKMLSRMSKDMQDVSRRMLSFVPQKRCTMEHAMTHPAFAHHHTPEKEIAAQSSICPTLSDWEKHSIEEYKAEVGKLMVEANAWVWKQKEERPNEMFMHGSVLVCSCSKQVQRQRKVPR